MAAPRPGASMRADLKGKRDPLARVPKTQTDEPRRRRILDRLIALAAVLAVGGLFSHGLFGKGGVAEVWRLREAVAERDARIRDLAAENRRLSESVAGLKTDPLIQEREVREHLGYVRPGELVYREDGG